MSAAQTGASQAGYQAEGMLLALGLRAVLSALPRPCPLCSGTGGFVSLSPDGLGSIFLSAKPETWSELLHLEDVFIYCWRWIGGWGWGCFLLFFLKKECLYSTVGVILNDMAR